MVAGVEGGGGVVSNYCKSCGVPVPPGQNYCSMCYGDPDYGSDGYMRQLMERERKAKELEEAMAEEEADGA